VARTARTAHLPVVRGEAVLWLVLGVGLAVYGIIQWRRRP
jgi:hypothetical protein